MGDMGDMFNAWRKVKKEKKQSNLEQSTSILEQSKFDFESRNGGVHLIVYAVNEIIDYWPSTGKWIVRSNKKTARGIKQLLAECERISENNP